MSRALPLLVVCPFLVVPLAVAQEKKVEPPKAALVGRLELDHHKESFTARFFLRNTTAKDIEVIYGSGGAGKSVVPTLTVTAGSTTLFIHPPTYHFPPRKAMEPDKLTIPAGKEVLYGTFTMGYPPLGPMLNKEVSVDAVIRFEEAKETAISEPVTLRLPSGKGSKNGNGK